MKKSTTTTSTTAAQEIQTLTADGNKVILSAIRAMRTSLKSFVTFGEQHEKIKDLVLLKYKSMKSFIETELGIVESDYYRRVRAYEVHEIIRKSGHVCLPHVESVCRQITLNLIDGLLKGAEPKEVKGLTADDVLLAIWNDAFDKKADGLTKAEQAKVKLTANEVFMAVSRWKSLHSGKPPVETPDPKAPKKAGTPEIPDSTPELPQAVRQAAMAVPGKAEEQQGKAPDNTPAIDGLKPEDVKAKLAEQRTELAKLRAENAKLGMKVKANISDWQTSELFRQIWAAGKAAVIAKAFESNDSEVVAAVQTLEKEIFKA